MVSEDLASKQEASEADVGTIRERLSEDELAVLEMLADEDGETKRIGMPALEEKVDCGSGHLHTIISQLSGNDLVEEREVDPRGGQTGSLAGDRIISLTDRGQKVVDGHGTD